MTSHEATPSPIDHEADASRFTTRVDGELARVDYEIDGGVMRLTHTVVPEAIGGRGIAGRLVQAALEHARSKDLKVRPECSYASAWVGKHPEYADLVA